MEGAVMQRADVPEARLAPAVMALGGVLGFAGSLLTWTSVRLGPAAGRAQGQPGRERKLGRIGSLTVTGFDTTGGRTVMALSIALIVVALLAFVAYWFWLRLGAITVGLVLAVIALVSSAVDLASPAPSPAFQLALLRVGDRRIPASAGVGVYLAVAGAALAVAAAVAWLMANRGGWASFDPLRKAPVPSPPGSRTDEQPTTPLPPTTTNPGLAPD